MRQSLRQPEPPLRQSEYHCNDTFPERHYTPSSIEDTNSSFFEDAIDTPQGSGALHEYDDLYYPQYGSANDFSQSHMLNIGLDAEGTASHDPQASQQAPRLAPRNDDGLLRGVENYAELSSLSTRSREITRDETQTPLNGFAQPHNMHRKSFSLASPAATPMQSLPYPSSRHSSAPPQRTGQTAFAPFGGMFRSSQEAKQHRHIKMRFDRRAYDEHDQSIPQIEADRELHVARIYNAMTRGDIARDNYKSTAMKRWTRDPHYPSNLVEAYAHKVFDCLLLQAKEGFRGWHHNDYVVDDRKGDDEDRDINCAGRLDNIILALEQEKTICEDVMTSACQIRMFVNAPRAYANRKHQNRIGNSKRPNAGVKDASDSNPRPSKARKTGGRRTRGRSSTTSDLPASRSTTPQQPRETTGLPYFTTPALQRVATSPPTGNFLAPPAPTMHRPITRSHRGSFSQHQSNVMSPSALSPRAPPRTPQLPHVPRITSIPPKQQSPFMSPSPLSNGHFSASATPDEVQSSLVDLPSSPWQPTDTFGEPSCTDFQQSNPAGDRFFAQVVDWSQNVSAYTPNDVTASTNYFEQYPEAGVALANVEQPPWNEISDNTHNLDFPTFWQQQQGVQPFPYHAPHSEHQDQP